VRFKRIRPAVSESAQAQGVTASAVWRLLCHGSNSEKVPLCRTAILTPQRLECASRSKHGLRTAVHAAARPGLLGTPGLVLFVAASPPGVCGQPLAAVSQFGSGLLKHWAIWFARGELAKGAVMSDEFHFNDEDDAEAEIRYLLEGIAGTDRGDIVREIIAIVNEVARGLPPSAEDPPDDGMPGG
jgi:hypothetical protein